MRGLGGRWQWVIVNMMRCVGDQSQLKGNGAHEVVGTWWAAGKWV